MSPPDKSFIENFYSSLALNFGKLSIGLLVSSIFLKHNQIMLLMFFTLET